MSHLHNRLILIQFLHQSSSRAFTNASEIL